MGVVRRCACALVLLTACGEDTADMYHCPFNLDDTTLAEQAHLEMSVRWQAEATLESTTMRSLSVTLRLEQPPHPSHSCLRLPDLRATLNGVPLHTESLGDGETIDCATSCDPPQLALDGVDFPPNALARIE